MHERHRCTFAEHYPIAAAISPRCDTLSLNFHILASGWTRQHHLTSDGMDISLSGDAWMCVSCLCGRGQSDREVRVQHEVTDATHDALCVPAPRCPHDIRCTAFETNWIFVKRVVFFTHEGVFNPKKTQSQLLISFVKI